MAEALRIEAPSEDLAHALMARLQAYPTELKREDGRIEVRVALVGKVDRMIVEVLDGVDAWLVDCEVHATRVHLDERVYTLTAPAATER
jgi:hypothetical protein